MNENSTTEKYIQETAERFGLEPEGIRHIHKIFTKYYLEPCNYKGYGWRTDFEGFLIGYLTASHLISNTLNNITESYINTEEPKT
jgi:hypothetical protein